MDALKRSRNFLIGLLLLLLFVFVSFDAEAKGPHRHFDLEAGDASLMLNEFSRQSDLQVLFDFNILRGMKTRAVTGELDVSTALKTMLNGTNLVFDFVNDHTLAVTPKKPGVISRLWQRLLTGKKKSPKTEGSSDDLKEIVVAANKLDIVHPQIGELSIQLGREAIDQSGYERVGDYVRTLPQVWGGGATQDTYIGREAGTNATRGDGFNLRGTDAGGAVVLVDSHRIAMSGTAAGWADISNLPLSAIQTVTILADGSSISRGADAISGIVNFTTRHDIEGLNSVASVGTLTDGGMGRQTYSTLFGHRWDSGQMMLALDYQLNQALPARDRGQATSDLRPWGGPNYDSNFGSPGTVLLNGKTYAIPKITGGPLIPGTQNLYDVWSNVDILQWQRHLSLVATAKQSIGEGVNLWVDSWLSRRHFVNSEASGYPDILQVPATNPFYRSPANDNQPVTILYGFGQDLGPLVNDGTVDAGTLNFGADFTLGDWTLSGSIGYAFERLRETLNNTVDESALSASLSDENPDTAFNAFGGAMSRATLDKIRSSLQYRYYSDYRTLSASAARTLLQLPAGGAELTVGGEYRQQTFDNRQLTKNDDVSSTQFIQRNLKAGFAEVSLPIFGEHNKLTLLHQMDVAGGVRYENYGDGLSVFVPRFGLSWSPFSELSVRTTWSRSFRPPNLPDRTNVTSSQLAIVPDKSSPTGSATALVWSGNNSTLLAERASNLTFGVDFSPVDRTGVSATYFYIKSSNRVVEPITTPDVLDNVTTFQGKITRKPRFDQQRMVCESSSYFGDLSECLNTHFDVLIDGRLQNVQRLTTEGIDLSGKIALESPIGTWSGRVDGTYLLAYDLKQPNEPVMKLASTQNNPNRFRMRNMLSLELRDIMLTAFANYTNHYRDTNNPGRQVASWTTFDAQIGYRPAVERGLLKDWSLTVSVLNLFNRYPPYLANPIGVAYDQENGDLTGRSVALKVSAAF